LFDILIPVLGRPQNAQRVVDSIEAATTLPHRTLFICSQGDKEQIKACRATGADVLVCRHSSERSDYPKKMNAGFKKTSNDFIVLGSDDVDFAPGWDVLVERVVTLKRVGVYGTNDLSNRHVMRGLNSTHPIVRRSYVDTQGGALEGPGVLISETYDHNFSERELTGLAMWRRKWMFMPKVHLKHLHPAWGSAPDDETYKKGAANFRGDQDHFYLRCKAWADCGLTSQEKTYAKKIRMRSRQAQATIERTNRRRGGR
jgi:glycosyltransferase involved in cell wall biosynthesis